MYTPTFEKELRNLNGKEVWEPLCQMCVWPSNSPQDYRKTRDCFKHCSLKHSAVREDEGEKGWSTAVVVEQKSQLQIYCPSVSCSLTNTREYIALMCLFFILGLRILAFMYGMHVDTGQTYLVIVFTCQWKYCYFYTHRQEVIQETMIININCWSCNEIFCRFPCLLTFMQTASWRWAIY